MRIADVGAELTLAESTVALGASLACLRYARSSDLGHSKPCHADSTSASRQTPKVHICFRERTTIGCRNCRGRISPPDLGEVTIAWEYELAIGCEAPDSVQSDGWPAPVSPHIMQI